MLAFLRTRSVVEVMTLAFTGLIAFVVVLGAALVAVAELLDPTVDTSQIVDGLTGIITGILGALLGCWRVRPMRSTSPHPKNETHRSGPRTGLGGNVRRRPSPRRAWHPDRYRSGHDTDDDDDNGRAGIV